MHKCKGYFVSFLKTQKKNITSFFRIRACNETSRTIVIRAHFQNLWHQLTLSHNNKNVQIITFSISLNEVHVVVVALSANVTAFFPFYLCFFFFFFWTSKWKCNFLQCWLPKLKCFQKQKRSRIFLEKKNYHCLCTILFYYSLHSVSFSLSSSLYTTMQFPLQHRSQTAIKI